MADIRLSADTTKLTAFLDSFPRQTTKASLRALKRGTKSAGTTANRLAARDMGLKVGDVRKRIKLVPPNGRTLTGELRASLARIPLILFGAKGPEPSRGRGRGVSYRGKGGRKRAAEAFIATMPSGHRGVYERKRRPRLPIRQLFGASVGRVVGKHSAEIMARGGEVFEKELDRLLDRILAA